MEFLQNFGTIPLMLGDPGPYKCQQGQQSPCLFFKDGLSSPFVIVSRIRQVAVPLAPHLTPASRLTPQRTVSAPQRPSHTSRPPHASRLTPHALQLTPLQSGASRLSEE